MFRSRMDISLHQQLCRCFSRKWEGCGRGRTSTPPIPFADARLHRRWVHIL